MSACKCGARWGGMKTSHCMRCHETFTTVANFDRHQRGGACLPPAKAGLVAVQRAGYVAWGMPGIERTWEVKG